MKKVSLICKSAISPIAVNYIIETFRFVLGDYAVITPYYIDQLKRNEIVDADAHLVLYEEMLPNLTSNLLDYSKVIIVKPSIRKSNLLPLNDIPSNTDVLVINDSREGTLQTVQMLYELGFNHLVLHPYIEGITPNKSYNSFEYCITTNDALSLVPKNCHKIFNIRHREISFETLQKLVRILDINNPAVQKNILSKVEEDVKTNYSFIEDYLSNYLKEQLLTTIVGNFTQGVVLIDKYGKINYTNEKGYQIFGLIAGEYFNTSSNYNKSFDDNPDFRNKLISIGGLNYMVEKQSLGLFNDIFGYCLILQDEKDLRDSETNLNRQLKSRGLYAKHTFDDIIHESQSMKKCINLAKHAATSDYTILLRGESGTGKELLAQSIHNFSSRSKAPFVAINCAALPESLLESELFGYVGGAFTGADKNGKVGLFEQAQHGTIFLDEIGDISPNLQARLLRVIQEKQVMRIGSDKIINIDVRIIAATNADLEKKIAIGEFRAELFYRLNVIPLNILPLRSRKEDILPLLSHYMGKSFGYLSAKERNILTTYSWPGNIRELENTASYFKLLGSLPENLYDVISNSAEESPNTSGQEQPIPSSKLSLPDLVLEIIADSTNDSIGIGRMSIIERLSQKGYVISEGRMKGLLKSLQEAELIISTLGRGGSYITGKGLDHLNSIKKARK